MSARILAQQVAKALSNTRREHLVDALVALTTPDMNVQHRQEIFACLLAT